MCDYLKGVTSAVVFLGIITVAMLLEDTGKKYRVVEDPDELGYWLEEDDDVQT